MLDDASHDLLLDLLAVCPGGLSSAALVEAAQAEDPTLKAVTYGDLQSLQHTSLEQGYRWFIDPIVGEARYRALAQQDRLDAIEELAERVDPWMTEHPWGGLKTSRQATERMVRHALRMADDELLDQCLKSGANLDVERWFADPFPTETFAGFSPRGAQLTGATFLLRIDDDGVPLPVEAERAFLARGDELGAEVALRRGRLDDAAAFLDGDGRTWFHHGLLALLRGDVKASVKDYGKALSALRKAWGSSAVPYGLAGYWLPVAYVLSGTKTRRKQAATLIRRVEREHPFDPRQGWLSLQCLENPKRPHSDCDHPFAVVLRSYVARWQGSPLPESVLADARRKLQRMGHDLLAAELGPESRVAPLRETRAPWQDLLVRLEEVAGGKVAAPAKVAEKRLAWTVTVYGTELVVEAREQLRRGKGWSAGRKIADRRLHGANDTDLPWTDADRRLVKGMRKNTRRDWRGYTHADFHWDASAWAGLIDHPHLFDTHGEPIRVVARPPQLIVDEVDGQLQVRIEPEVGDKEVRVTAVGSGYEVTMLDKEQREAAALLRGGARFPLDARDRLQPIVAKLGDRFVAPTAQVTREAPNEVGAWLRPQGNTLVVDLGVQPLGPNGPRMEPGQGEPLLLTTENGRGVRVARDLVAERAQARAVLSCIDEPAELPSHSFASLVDGLAFLARAREAGVPLHWPEGGELVVRRPKKVDVRLSSRKEWFEAGGSLDLGDKVLQLADVLQGVLEHGRFVRLDDGSYVELEAQLHRRLDALARLADDKGRVHALAAPAVSDLTEVDGVRVTAAATRLLERSQAPFEAPPVPSVLRASLRPYQSDAFRWLCGLAHLGVGGILADDMGLGKTITTLAFLLHRRADGPALVVAPTSVAGNWMREVARFAPDLRVHRLGVDPLPDPPGPGDLVVASYGLLLARTSVLSAVPWHTLVFDESQALKNADTQRFGAAASLGADVVICLTGTPIENHLDELHSQLALVAPGLLPERRPFRSRFSAPIERDDPDARRLLRTLVAPFLLRRTKDAVLDDLPPRIDNELVVELSTEERAVYEAQRRAAVAAVDEGQGAIQVLAHLTKLRRIACSAALVTDAFTGASSKTTAFRRLARDLVDNGHRALVFSQFLDHLALLRAVLGEEGFDHIYLDGSTPSKERDGLVQQFQTTDVPFFLISLRAGGTGLNLTGADFVLHMDPWWNPAVEDQASDRAHRIGQQRPVTVYRVVAKDTVEEQILELHRSKRDLADRILAGQEKVVKLGVEELRGLLEGP